MTLEQIILGTRWLCNQLLKSKILSKKGNRLQVYFQIYQKPSTPLTTIFFSIKWIIMSSGNSVKWLQSYVCIFYSNKSDLQNIICGVPQGSILGPLLLIFISTISVILQMFLILFCLTYDTTILYHYKDIASQINYLINRELLWGVARNE